MNKSISLLNILSMNKMDEVPQTEKTVHKWAIEDIFKGDEWSCQKDY